MPQVRRGPLPGEKSGFAADAWALGVLLYEMASGRLPFDGATQTAVIAAVVKDAPEALPSSASAGLRTVVQRCLQKEPGRRYGHSAAVHAALEAVQSGTAEAASAAAVASVASAATSIAVLPFTNLGADPEQEQIYTFSEQGLDRAIELIDEAAAIVGDHELLHATKGTVYFQYVNAALKDDHDYIELAEESARRVFALKPDSPHGLALLGLVRLLQSRQPESVRLFKRALALDPHRWYAIVELGRIYHGAGRSSEARTQYSVGLAVDPMSPILRGALLSNDMMAGHLDIALRDLPALVQAVPPFGYLRWTYAVSLIAAGRVAEALVVLDAMPEEPAPTIAGRCCVFLKLALEGRREQAAASIGEAMSRRARRVEWWSGWIAECYAFIDDHDQALDWLENAVQRGYFPYPYIATHSPTFRKLDRNPAFRELLGRIKTRWEQFEP